MSFTSVRSEGARFWDWAKRSGTQCLSVTIPVFYVLLFPVLFLICSFMCPVLLFCPSFQCSPFFHLSFSCLTPPVPDLLVSVCVYIVFVLPHVFVSLTCLATWCHPVNPTTVSLRVSPLVEFSFIVLCFVALCSSFSLLFLSVVFCPCDSFLFFLDLSVFVPFSFCLMRLAVCFLILPPVPCLYVGPHTVCQTITLFYLLSITLLTVSFVLLLLFVFELCLQAQ